MVAADITAAAVRKTEDAMALGYVGYREMRFPPPDWVGNTAADCQTVVQK
jgi:hypothetical protein